MDKFIEVTHFTSGRKHLLNVDNIRDVYEDDNGTATLEIKGRINSMRVEEPYQYIKSLLGL